jgi:hypothetical protein
VGQEHDRSEDLLWSGTAFREFQLWRERYPGGLTEIEEAYARAVVVKAERTKRRRRNAMAAAILVLLGVVGVFDALWQQAEYAQRLSEASKLVALGQIEIEDYPTAAVAYAIASLEVADTPEARRFALSALWKGPTAITLPGNAIFRVDFGPDGELRAIGEASGNGEVWSADGQTNQRNG